MTLALIWIGSAILVGIISRARGLGFRVGFCWSLAFSALVGIVVTILMLPRSSDLAVSRRDG